LTSVSTPEINVPSQYVLTQSNPPNGLPPNYKVRPFTTNITYDEFDNATSSGGNYWHDITWNLNATPQSFTTTYVNGRAKKDGVAGKVYNNRDEVWSYNAMGQVANDTRTVQTFDSAGQTTRTEDVANAQIYVNYVYDGDGRQVKFDQKREDGTTELRYRIYSTALGGLLSDVKATGQKIETRVYTFVYPESAVRQVKAYSVPNYGSYPDTVVFEGSDPHGTRATVWDRDTNTSKTLALAAPGAYVEDINWQGMRDRYVSGIGSQIAYGQVAASRALDAHNMTIDPRNPGTGCSLDGVKERCDKVIRAANQGALKSIAFSTTGGSGGVGGDTGILAGVFSNAQGSLKGNQSQACQNNCAIGPDGEPITPATVYPTNFFSGFGAGFGLTGEQQSGGGGASDDFSTPCDKVKASDLDWFTPRSPSKRDSSKDALQHIYNRHIDTNQHPDGSKFVFNKTDNVSMFRQVAQTVARGEYIFTQGKDKAVKEVRNGVTSYLIVVATPRAFSGNHAVEGIGIDANMSMKMTNVATLVLASNCKNVITFHPGTPKNFDNNKIVSGKGSIVGHVMVYGPAWWVPNR
jgi:hypothetical protein